MKKKERKIPQGAIRDKERTKLKLIQAVGEIIRTEGYTGLGVNKISYKAGVNKKLIYRYFENVDNLVEVYIRGKNYWTTIIEQLNFNELKKKWNDKAFSSLLNTQLDVLYDSEEIQHVLLWELGEDSALMHEITEVRENFTNDLLQLTETTVASSAVDFRSLIALQLAGIYYLVLHGHFNKQHFCGLDFSKGEDRDRIKQTLIKINAWAFKEAKSR
ncbi:transcriptional regulator [Olivibacter ginsenosidimutans]|uniref:Transcriptional regulator n=1 Tax=Olivibacter ginsenosidimutans TaxID=1176537 RepID=A0ABP9AJW6_9SPHI